MNSFATYRKQYLIPGKMFATSQKGLKVGVKSGIQSRDYLSNIGLPRG